MKNKFIKLTVAFLTVFGLGSLLTLPTFACEETNPGACAENICDCQCVSSEIKAASGCPGATTGTLENSLQSILNSVILILGIVAVIAIVVGGVWYMTSAGDAGKVKKAKDTILYACIGLVVCALAAVIVNWTISAINGSGAPAGGSEGGTEEVIEADPAETGFLSENSIAFLEKKL